MRRPPTIRREIRRRAGIEPVIGHMKTDGHLGRNFLAGATGDANNVILTAAGHNLRLLRAWLIRLLAILISLLAISTSSRQVPPTQHPMHWNRITDGRRDIRPIRAGAANRSRVPPPGGNDLMCQFPLEVVSDLEAADA